MNGSRTFAGGLHRADSLQTIARGVGISAAEAAAALGLLVVCATSAWYAPVATWAVTLALFGLPHAVVELGWLNVRYRGRLRDRTHRLVFAYTASGAALTAIVGLRVLAASGVGGGLPLATLELVAAALLVAAWLPLLDAARSRRAAVLGVLACTALALGIVARPIDTLVVCALLHNLTPIGLLAERIATTRDALLKRRRTLIGAAAAAAVLATATVLAAGLAPGSPVAEPSGRLLATGLSGYVPSFIPAERALDLFRAAAFLQCAHYACVLWILPRIGARDADDRAPPTRFRLPHRTAFVIVVALSLTAATGFSLDFDRSKATYGLIAAVHAWVEWPILLLALGGGALLAPCDTHSHAHSTSPRPPGARRPEHGT